MANGESRDAAEKDRCEDERLDEAFALPEDPARYLTRLIASAHRRKFRERELRNTPLPGESRQ